MWTKLLGEYVKSTKKVIVLLLECIWDRCNLNAMVNAHPNNYDIIIRSTHDSRAVLYFTQPIIH